MSIYGDSILYEVTVSSTISLVMTDGGAYHLHVAKDPLWWPSEASHVHAVDSVALAIPLVHPDAGEDYLYLDDNDGNPITIVEIIPPITLVHTDAGEDYCDLDDNGGIAIDLGTITLSSTQEAYHVHVADVVDIEALAWTVEAQTGGSIVTLGSWTPLYTFRSLINGGDIANSGSQMRMKLTGINHTFAHDIDFCSIMKRASDYDAAAPPTQVTFDVGSASKDWDFGDVWSDWITIDVEPGHDLLVHFDMGSSTALSGAADAVYPSRYFPNGTTRSKNYYTVGDMALWPQWTRDNDEAYYDTNNISSNKYNWPGGMLPYNYVILVSEIQVRGTPYTANELYIHRGVHKVVSEQILLAYRWRSDFGEFTKGGSSAPVEYPPSIVEDIGYTANATYAITGDGAGNVSMATFKLITTSLSTHRFAYFEKGPSYNNADDVEILTKLKTDQNSDHQMKVALRCWADTGYLGVLEVASDQVVIYRQLTDSTYSSLNNAAMSLAADTWYWVRFRANGTNLSLKVWADGGAEPGPWTVTTTDSTHTRGFTGLKKYAPTGSFWCDYYEIATGGLSAAGTLLVDVCSHSHVAGNLDLSLTAWSGTVPSEGTVAAARNYRMIIAAADWDYGDSDGFIRLKVEAPPTEAITINGASIGRRATSGELFDYDSTAVLHVRFTFDGGSASKALSAGETAWSDWVPFAVDDTLDHLVHVYVNTAHKFPYNTTDWCYEASAGNDQTMIADVKNYSLINQFLFLIRMEVRARVALPGDLNCYHVLDDNDGVAIEIFSVESAAHTMDSSDPLWWVQEAYHTHVIRDPLWWVNNSYHLHVADQCDPVVIMPVQEAYHVIATQDPLWWVNEAYHLHAVDALGGFDFWLATAEAYHVIATQDPLWWINETYHLHVVDAASPFSVHEAYHLHAIDAADVFSVHEAYHAHAIDVADVFSVEAAYHLHFVDAVELTSGILGVQEAYHLFADEPPLWWVQEAYHVQAADNIALNIPLITAEAYHLFADEPPLWWVSEAYHVHAVDAVPAFTLWVNIAEAYHDHVADNIDLQSALAIAEAYHLVIGQDPLWWVNEAYHTHAADNVILGLGALVVAEAYHDHAVDAITAFTLWINTAEAYHVVATQDPLWWVDESAHVVADDGPIALGTITLATADCAHTHAVDAIPGFDITLVVAEAANELASDNINLVGMLDIAETYHDHVVEGPIDLSLTLVPAGAFHVHAVDAIAGFDITITIEETFHLLLSDTTQALPESLLTIVLPLALRSMTTDRTLIDLTPQRRLVSL
jgi:hypothetical protein